MAQRGRRVGYGMPHPTPPHPPHLSLGEELSSQLVASALLRCGSSRAVGLLGPCLLGEGSPRAGAPELTSSSSPPPPDGWEPLRTGTAGERRRRTEGQQGTGVMGGRCPQPANLRQPAQRCGASPVQPAAAVDARCGDRGVEARQQQGVKGQGAGLRPAAAPGRLGAGALPLPVSGRILSPCTPMQAAVAAAAASPPTSRLGAAARAKAARVLACRRPVQGAAAAAASPPPASRLGAAARPIAGRSLRRDWGSNLSRAGGRERQQRTLL